MTPALSIPAPDTSALNHDISPGSLKRSNSSPSVLSGSSDTLSPRDSISDIVQFGPKLDRSKGAAKSSSSSDSEPASAPRTDGSGKVAEPGVTVDNNVSTRGDTVTEVVKDKTVQTKDSVKSVKFDGAAGQSDNKEFTSMLTRQLSPSPASSEGSSTLDELTELPTNLNTQRQRGHTIHVTQQTTNDPSHGQGHRQSGGSFGAGGAGSGSSKETTRVGVSPSFVFLQLYHTGQLQVNEAPILLPQNEVGALL